MLEVNLDKLKKYPIKGVRIRLVYLQSCIFFFFLCETDSLFSGLEIEEGGVQRGGGRGGPHARPPRLGRRPRHKRLPPPLCPGGTEGKPLSLSLFIFKDQFYQLSHKYRDILQTSRATVLTRLVQIEAEVIAHLDGLCLSIVDETPQELLFIFAEKMYFEYTNSNLSQTLEIIVHTVQVLSPAFPLSLSHAVFLKSRLPLFFLSFSLSICVCRYKRCLYIIPLAI